jgi:hypothetical protein
MCWAGVQLHLGRPGDLTALEQLFLLALWPRFWRLAKQPMSMVARQTAGCAAMAAAGATGVASEPAEILGHFVCYAAGLWAHGLGTRGSRL